MKFIFFALALALVSCGSGREGGEANDANNSPQASPPAPIREIKYSAEFVLIKAGSFTMGSPLSELNREPKETPHSVTISKDFEMQVTPVTQLQYLAIMGVNPSEFSKSEHCKNYDANSKSCPDNPVEKVSWKDAKSYIKRLNKLNDGYKYRLPTEAEWEYAARAGTKTSYYFGNDIKNINEYAWYWANSKSQTQIVGTKKPNAWGLYDMAGNVWQWTEDNFNGKEYSPNPVVDPTGPQEGDSKIMRGGSWYNYPKYLRSAMRGSGNKSYDDVGFRVVRTKLN